MKFAPISSKSGYWAKCMIYLSSVINPIRISIGKNVHPGSYFGPLLQGHLAVRSSCGQNINDIARAFSAYTEIAD